MKEQSRQSLLSACFVAVLPGILACGMVACETGKSEPNQAAGAGGTDGGSTAKGGNTAGGEGGAGASAARGGSGADDGGAVSKNGGSGGAAEAGAGGAAEAGASGAADAGAGGAADAGAGGGGDGGEGGAETCDDFSCPELGTCGVQREGARCIRVCTLNEEYIIRTDDDVAQLAALRCEVINGSLTVGGTEITNLLGLETIREVTGSLRMTTYEGSLSDVSGLRSLETVGQHFNIQQCEHLISVELPVLKSVGGYLGLVVMPLLESIRLPALKSTGGNLGIVQNPALTTVQLDALESVDQLSIGSNDSLLTLNGLPSLAHANSLIISFNPKLSQCEVDAIVERTGTSCSPCNGNDKTAVCE